MIFQRFKTKILMLTIGIFLIAPMPAKAQESCQIRQTERTLFSHPVANLTQKIKQAIQLAKLEGEVQQILWADGLQAYEFIGGKPEIYAPSAELFSVDSLAENIYIFNSKKVGNHYKLDTPAWEFSNSRLVAKEVTKIDGASDGDAPWLLVKTDREGYYVLRIETRGGVPPECNFEGILGVPYQTLYVILKTNTPQAFQ